MDAINRDRFIGDSIFDVLVLAGIGSKRVKSVCWGRPVGREEREGEGEGEEMMKLNIFNEVNIYITSITLLKTQTLNRAILHLQSQLSQKIQLFQSIIDQLPLPSDLDIKSLPTCKLYAKKRIYIDEPQPKTFTPLKLRKSLKDGEAGIVLPPIGIKEASRYEEFQVVKINGRGVEQTRIIGFDQSKYFNYDMDLRRKNKEANLFTVLFTGNNILTGTKNPEKPITSILAINSLRGTGFELVLAQKKIEFKAKSNLDKQKIMMKVNFLIQFHQNKLEKM